MKIPDSEIEFSFARSSGPGGQNVNKVNSKAVLRWSPMRTRAFGPDQVVKLARRLERYLNKEGEVVLSSDRFRDQTRNRQDCIEKLHALVAGALREKKKRKKTKPTLASRKKGVEKKRRLSEKKNLRRRVISD